MRKRKREYVCFCVRGRDKERLRERDLDSENVGDLTGKLVATIHSRHLIITIHSLCRFHFLKRKEKRGREREKVCVCVCVCVREREREKKRVIERETVRKRGSDRVIDRHVE